MLDIHIILPRPLRKRLTLWDFFSVLELGPKALGMGGKYSTTDIHPQPVSYILTAVFQNLGALGPLSYLGDTCLTPSGYRKVHIGYQALYILCFFLYVLKHHHIAPQSVLPHFCLVPLLCYYFCALAISK